MPLNDIGRAQAREAARVLVTLETNGVFATSRLFSSPLGRAIETAEVIGDVLSCGEVAVHEGLIERNFGAAEGLAVSDAEARWPGLDVPDAEPLDLLATRSAEVFQTLLDESPGAIAVAHGAMLRQGFARLCDVEVPRILNGEVWLLSRSDSGECSVKRAG